MNNKSIGIVGATGFLGAHLAQQAHNSGWQVVGFSRKEQKSIPHCDEARVFPRKDRISVEGLGAVVNFAGESILSRWTKGKKRRILESRVAPTLALVETLAALPAEQRPRVLVNASGIGYYGDTGEEAADESSPQGAGFLAEVCQSWEEAALKASDLGVRVVLLRIGFVLAENGGAISMIRPVFRSGLAGRFGSGKQFMSWVHAEDVAGLALAAIDDPDFVGPLNAVAPEPVRNTAFTRILAKAARRPAFFHAPSFALRLALGEMSSLMLDSLRVHRRALPAFRPKWSDLQQVAQAVFPARPA
ncbi:MAG: TIGR01777 family oxidoreductase [Verrucomicrobiales bacterium]